MGFHRNLILAGVVLFALAGCAFWGLTVAFAWAYRDFVLCWTPCANRAAIVEGRTNEAIGFSLLLAINLIAFIGFVLSRRRAAIVALGTVQLLDLVISGAFGLTFALSSDLGTALQGWIGGALAGLTLGLLLAFNRWQPKR